MPDGRGRGGDDDRPAPDPDDGGPGQIVDALADGWGTGPERKIIFRVAC